MKKVKEYFSHEYFARQDEKIIHLLSEMGMEGYGIYWSLVELLYQNDGRFHLNYKSISFVIHVEIENVKRVINEFSLFKIEGEFFFSESLLKRIELRNELSKTRTNAVKSRWDTNVLQNDKVSNTNRYNIKKKKSNINKESIINNTKENDFEIHENENSGPIDFEKIASQNEFELLNSHAWIEQAAMNYRKAPQETADLLAAWIEEMKLKHMMARPLNELKNHFINVLKNHKKSTINGKESTAQYLARIAAGVH